MVKNGPPRKGAAGKTAAEIARLKTLLAAHQSALSKYLQKKLAR